MAKHEITDGEGESIVIAIIIIATAIGFLTRAAIGFLAFGGLFLVAFVIIKWYERE